MSRDERERLDDILEALEAIRGHVGGSLEAPSIDGSVVLDAVLFRLIVIGEAAKNVGAALREAAPDIRWSDYAGLRDIIAHQYFRIQKQIIEETVQRDLPVLLRAVEGLLA
ncbi:MAG: HepT-like ribonuclease domain-containing protein [Baekduia sp.]